MTEALQQEIRTLRSLFNSDRDPDGRVFAPLADAYRRSGQLQDAVRLLNEGLTRLPDFVPGHVVAAQLYVEQGLAEEAEIAATSALALDSENVNALGSLLRVLEERGDVPAAAEIRARLILLEPDFTAEAGVEEAGPSGAVPAGLEEASLVDWEGAAAATPERTIETGLDGEASESEVETLEMPALTPEPEPAGSEDTIGMDGLGESSAPEPEMVGIGPESDGDIDMPLSLDEGPDAADALSDEAVFDLDALAPDAPDVAPVTEEPVFDLDALAPAAPDEEVVDLDALAPGAAESGDALSVDALAPDVESVSEPVFDLDALAPEPESKEPVLEMSALAPEPESEEPVLEMSALAPEPESEEPVLEMSALAPEPEEPVLEMSALAPAPEPEPEEPVLEMSALAPESEESVIDMDALAPTAEEAVIDLDALAPEPEQMSDELVIDLDALAPEPEPTSDELVIDLDTLAPDPTLEDLSIEGASEEPVIDMDELAASAPDDASEEEAASEAPDPEPDPDDTPASKTDDAPSGDEDPGEPVYTRTLASLYETQGAISEALRVLRRLHAADPDDQDLAQRIGELEARLESMDGGEHRVENVEEEEEEEVETLARDLAQSGEGEHDVDSPFAWAEHAEEEEESTGPSMREYFEDLLSWEPDEES